jgi:hypothetical protein
MPGRIVLILKVMLVFLKLDQLCHTTHALLACVAYEPPDVTGLPEHMQIILTQKHTVLIGVTCLLRSWLCRPLERLV